MYSYDELMEVVKEQTVIEELKMVEAELREMRLARQRHADTIHFAENVINAEIMKNVRTYGIKAETSIEFYKYSNDTIKLVKRSSISYANGNASYEPTGEYLNHLQLIDYLANHGFTVKEEKSSFKWYGCGNVESILLKITVKNA